MKVSKLLLYVGITFLVFPLLLAQSSPESREITDPKSIVSEANGAAYPIPVEDLFYTRNVSGPAWSPDGKEVVFSTDMSGRVNLFTMLKHEDAELQEYEKSLLGDPEKDRKVYEADR